jgi:signal transduction histidine kinase
MLAPSRPPASRSRLRLPVRTARLRLTLLYAALFLATGAGMIALILGGYATQHGQVRDLLLAWSGIALVTVTVLSIPLGYYIAGRVLKPLRTITSTARAISARNLQERLALGGPDDEFKTLGDTLDDLLARLQTAFDAQQHFVANASHELRTPLTVERSLLQVALADPNPTIDSLLTTCQNALVANEQQRHLIEGLLTLAGSESGLDHQEPVDLAQLTEHALPTLRSESNQLGLQIATKLEPAPTTGDPRLLERLITNLIENAIHHNTPHGHVQITTANNEHHACLTVTNSGPVIPAGDVQRLFQPFQRLGAARTRHTDDGYGLGLSIVKAIADGHHAELRGEARPEGGLTIQVSFPTQPTLAAK